MRFTRRWILCLGLAGLPAAMGVGCGRSDLREPTGEDSVLVPAAESPADFAVELDFNFPDPPTEGEAEYFPIAVDGESRCVIVRAANAPREDVASAGFLRNYLQRVTGTTIALVSEDEIPAGFAQIHVGETRRAQETELALPDVRYGTHDLPNLSGYLVITPDPDTLILRGATSESLRNGVAGFLRRYAGVRQYWQGPPGDVGDVIPSRPTLFVPEVVWRDWPYVYSRHLTNMPIRGGKLQHLDFSRPQQTIPVSENYFIWLPVDEYRETHPEYFPEMSGERQVPPAGAKSRWQPCVSNPEVQRIMADNVVAWFAENPDAVGVNFALNDGLGNCMCAPCRAMDAPGADYSRHLGLTDRYVTLTNFVSGRVEERFPGRILSFLAYQGTLHPPQRVVPKPTLMPVIAMGSRVNSYALWTEWMETGLPHLGLYVYQPDYLRVWPEMNMRHAARRLRFAAGTGRLRSFYGETRPLWPLSGIVTHILGELLWDPRLDVEEILDGFYKDMFGPAAADIRVFYETLEMGYQRAMRVFGIPHPLGYDARVSDPAYGAWGQFASLSMDEAARAREALNRARAVAERDGVDELIGVRLQLLDIKFRLQQMGAEYYWTLRRLESQYPAPRNAELVVADSRRLLALGAEMAEHVERVIDSPPASTYRVFNNPILRDHALINRIREGAPVARAVAALDAGISAAAKAHVERSGSAVAGAWWQARVAEEENPLLRTMFDAGRLIAEGRELALLMETDFDDMARTLADANLGAPGEDMDLDEARMALIIESAEQHRQGFGQIWFPDRSDNRRVLAAGVSTSGDYSLMFEYCHRLRFTRSIRATPGGQYRAGLRFRHNDEPGQYRLEIIALHRDRSRTTVLSRGLRGEPDEWQDVAFGFEAPADASTIFFNVFINGQAPESRCWIDDLFIGQYEGG